MGWRNGDGTRRNQRGDLGRIHVQRFIDIAEDGNPLGGDHRAGRGIEANRRHNHFGTRTNASSDHRTVQRRGARADAQRILYPKRFPGQCFKGRALGLRRLGGGITGQVRPRTQISIAHTGADSRECGVRKAKTLGDREKFFNANLGLGLTNRSRESLRATFDGQRFSCKFGNHLCFLLSVTHAQPFNKVGLEENIEDK